MSASTRPCVGRGNMDEDEFMEIINNSNMEEFMEKSSTRNVTVRDLHVGLKSMAEAMMIISDFIDAFFTAIDEESENRPGFSEDAIVFCQDMFQNAEKFCRSVADITYDEDDDDDEEYEDDDDEDTEE